MSSLPDAPEHRTEAGHVEALRHAAAKRRQRRERGQYASPEPEGNPKDSYDVFAAIQDANADAAAEEAQEE